MDRTVELVWKQHPSAKACSARPFPRLPQTELSPDPQEKPTRVNPDLAMARVSVTARGSGWRHRGRSRSPLHVVWKFEAGQGMTYGHGSDVEAHRRLCHCGGGRARLDFMTRAASETISGILC